MASFTVITRNKRTNRQKKAGRKRKRAMAQKSTASYDELFAEDGEPENDSAE